MMRQQTLIAWALVSAFATVSSPGRADAQLFGRPSSTNAGANGGQSYYPGYFQNRPASNGIFGGSDRSTQNGPLHGSGRLTRRTNTRTSGSNNSGTLPPAAPTSTVEPPLADDATSSEPALAVVLTVEVRLPTETAAVFVNNQLTRQTGTVRKFESPSLPPGEAFAYDIRAEWIVKGQRVSRTKTLTGRPGERIVADFQE
jgi:uncharacterized protein (TIGR03000 family)